MLRKLQCPTLATQKEPLTTPAALTPSIILGIIILD